MRLSEHAHLLGGLRPLGRLARLLPARDRALALASVMLLLPATAAPLLATYLLRLLVDGLAAGAWRGGAPVVIAVILAALLMVQRPIMVLQGWLQATMAEHLTLLVGQVVIKTGAELSRLTIVPEPGLRERVDLVRREAASRSGGLVNGMGLALAGWLGVAGAAVLLGTVHPALPILLVVGTIPHAVVQQRYALRQWRDTLSRAPDAAWSDYCTELATQPRSAKEIRLFGLGDHLYRRWRTTTLSVLGQSDRTRIDLARRSLAWTVASGLVVAATYAWMVLQASQGRITIGGVVMTLLATFRLQGALLEAGRSSRSVIQSLAFFGQLSELQDRGVDKPPRGRRERILAAPALGSLELRGVWFAYPGRQPVLSGLDLAMRPGEIVALVGENGAGKTTLVNVATGLLQPQRGRVLVDGVDVCEVRVDDHRARFAVLSQDYSRFALSARHNVGVGWMEHVEDTHRIARAADLAGAGVLAALPGGWDTPLTETYRGGVQLSGGEWQKVALARVLLSPARIVVLDEPTASLDAFAEHQLYEGLRRLLAGRTVIFITHRLWSSRVADRVLLLDGGRIAEEGTHAELVRRGGRYAELWRLQREALGVTRSVPLV